MVQAKIVITWSESDGTQPEASGSLLRAPDSTLQLDVEVFAQQVDQIAATVCLDRLLLRLRIAPREFLIFTRVLRLQPLFSTHFNLCNDVSSHAVINPELLRKCQSPSFHEVEVIVLLPTPFEVPLLLLVLLEVSRESPSNSRVPDVQRYLCVLSRLLRRAFLAARSILYDRFALRC